MKKGKCARKPRQKRMLAKDLKYFKEKLLDMRENLMAEIQGLSRDTLMKSQKDISGDISGYSIHLADVATDNYDREFNLNLVSNEHRTLLQIDEALKRIEDKTYGICQNCHKLIPKTRLNAVPYARYCRKCRDELESQNKV